MSHGSGIDLTRFPFREVPDIGEEPVRLVSAGRLVEKKGLMHAVEAVAEVNSDTRRVVYSIIGDGPERERLAARACELGAQDSIEILGWKTHAEISEILTRAHIFMAPCQTASNGNQDAPVNTLKEAMATGLPVIATEHGGIPELVEHGKSGLLVPERDTPALTAALREMLDMPERWSAMAHAGRAAVERLYDTNRLNDELVALYEGLLDQPPPSSVMPTPVTGLET